MYDPMRKSAEMVDMKDCKKLGKKYYKVNNCRKCVTGMINPDELWCECSYQL